MTSDHTDPARDAVDRLAAYAPDRATLDADWSPADRAGLRARILAGTGPKARIRFTPTPSRWRVVAPMLAGAAVVALIAGIIVVTARSGDTSGGDGLMPAGPEYTATDVTPTDEVGPHQYAYTVDSAYVVSAGGGTSGVERNENWIAPDGGIWSYRVTGKHVECYRFPHSGDANFGNPTKSFIDALPTDVDALETYLRDHVDGSTSRDEAVFVAVGDLLRTADGLATSKLRAALVSVLSRTGGVSVHPDVVDARNRPAVRADFVDDHNRPGELSSLYFAPSTYQFLEERNGSSGSPGTYSGPSPAYTAAPSGPASTSTELTGRSNVDVFTVMRVVDALPAKVQGCTVDGS